jgi:acyl-CoA thioesterase-2
MFEDNPFNTEEVLALLKLEQTATDRYRGQSHFMGSPNVFGGQVLGQSLYAATVTVDDRRPHSLHSLFLLPGNHRLPIDYEVERVRDGGSFSTRRVVALQEGRRIFVMSASFQVAEEGLSHQRPAPVMTNPESLASSLVNWRQHAESMNREFRPVPVDFRLEKGDHVYAGGVNTPYKNLWIKSPVTLPDDPLMHESLFAYVSDYGLLPTALQPHAIKMGDPRLQIASLDHTIWFHRPFRMDEWLYIATETPNASGGRGLSLAQVYNRDGIMVATLAQEGLMRLREKK